MKKWSEPHGVTVRAVNVGLPSEVEYERRNPKFANLKAEYYWALGERFADGDVAGLTNERAIKQLRRIRNKHDPKNRLAIESRRTPRSGVASRPTTPSR